MPKGYHYHHFIKEMLGPFLYYKNNIDNSVKILWIDQPIISPTGQDMELVNSEIKKLLFDFGMHVIDIEDLRSTDLTVDELITFAVGPRFLDIPNFIKNYIFGNTGYYHFPEINQELRNFFTPYMIDDKLKPKKIFISRKDANKSIRDKNLAENFNNRYLSPEKEDEIEKFFIDNNYKILSLSGMSIFDQISYFYNAEKIAGVSGTNLCNIIFSKNEIDLYEIFTHINYSYPWHKETENFLKHNRFLLEIYNEKNVYNYLERKINQ